MTANAFGFSQARYEWAQKGVRRLFPEAARAYWGDDCEIEEAPPRSRVDTTYGVDAWVRASAQHASVSLRLRGYSGVVRDQIAGRKPRDITFRYDSLQTAGRLLEVATATATYYWYGIANTEYPTAPSECLDWYLVRLQSALEALRSGRLGYKGPFPNTDESSRLIASDVGDMRVLDLIVCSKTPLPAASPSAVHRCAQCHVTLPRVPRQALADGTELCKACWRTHNHLPPAQQLGLPL